MPPPLNRCGSVGAFLPLSRPGTQLGVGRIFCLPPPDFFTLVLVISLKYRCPPALQKVLSYAQMATLVPG